jgi:hypothetical protein
MRIVTLTEIHVGEARFALRLACRVAAPSWPDIQRLAKRRKHASTRDLEAF